MAEHATAIKTSDVPVGGITAVDVDGRRIAVTNVGGTYYAFTSSARLPNMAK
jgi:nitrite reductase/ring-hydroxylating ferredoxin subunit